MNPAPELLLRDIHEPAAPAWWPPAPGWWIVAGIVLAIIVAFAWRAWRRRTLRLGAGRLFDATLAAHPPASPQRVAAMSELLRRAARRIDPAADRLQGDDWLRFLDGDRPQASFGIGPGRILLDGGFRRVLDDIDMAALERMVRDRFIDWMAPR